MQPGARWPHVKREGGSVLVDLLIQTLWASTARIGMLMGEVQQLTPQARSLLQIGSFPLSASASLTKMVVPHGRMDVGSKKSINNKGVKVKSEEKIFNYIKSNEEHSTMIGKIVMFNHNDDDDGELMEFSQWMASFMKRAEKFAKKSK
jgi:hypothetical protein